jgi:hypothetical protein
MCLLAYISPDAKVNVTGLEIACENNDDGFGWAIHCNDHIIVGRFMDAKEAIDTFMTFRELDPSRMSMFHARIGTHGSRSLLNCHPFVVPNEHKTEARVPSHDGISVVTGTVLGHNGILPVNMPKHDFRSDTRFFVEEELPKRSRTLWDNEWKVARLEKWMSGSKFVVLTTEPQYKRGGYIVNGKLGHWEDGTWWSNDSYSYPWYRGWSKKGALYAFDEWGAIVPSGQKAIGSTVLGEDVEDEWPYRSPFDRAREAGWEQCGICSSMLDPESPFDYCTSCGACVECFEDYRTCMCYGTAAPSSHAGRMEEVR